MQQRARKASGALAPRCASLARLAPSDRGIPRNPMAKTLAKQVTARPAVSARRAPQTANVIFTAVEENAADRRIVCNVSHSLTKPFSGGSAEIASTPTRNKALVQ